MTKIKRACDDVLNSFAKACPEPTARDVRRWTKRYPDYRYEIVTLAKALAEASGDDDVLKAIDELDETAAQSATETSPLDDKTFEDYREMMVEVSRSLPFPKDQGLVDILRWYGNTWPTLADFIGIDRKVLDLLAYGLLLEPIGPRFIDALSFAFETDPDLIRAGIAFDRLNERDTGSYVDPRKPEDAKTYRAAIDASDMSADRKAFWLEDALFPRWPRPSHPAAPPQRQLGKAESWRD